MAKTKEELNKIKNEVESVNNKLHELTPEELEQVTGGVTRGLGWQEVHQEYFTFLN